MKKFFNRINILPFYAIGSLLIAIALLSISTPALLYANSHNCDFGEFEAGIPGIPDDICSFIQESNPLIGFIKIIVDIVTAFIVSIGLISIVIGGFFYMTSGGSADKIKIAKDFVKMALFGIILALTSWLILNTISNQFTQPINDPNVSGVGGPCPCDPPLVCYEPTEGEPSHLRRCVFP